VTPAITRHHRPETEHKLKLEIGGISMNASTHSEVPTDTFENHSDHTRAGNAPQKVFFDEQRPPREKSEATDERASETFIDGAGI
jgi:hypothetical protein